MAIDADGNAYLLVNAADSGYYDGSDSGYKLVKINPEDWSYDSIRLQHNIMINNAYAWGMAFLDGKLYVATSDNPAVIHTVDPIKGGIADSGTVLMQNGREYGYGIDDMASCQTASAITGRVYLDANGDGKIDNNDKHNGKYEFVPQITVEIYDSPTGNPLGSQTTNSFGEYNFLVELQKTYYIRLKQPQIGAVNTQQTWASGGEFSWYSSSGIGSNGANVVTPACYNNDPKIYDTQEKSKWYSGEETKQRYTQKCYGANANGIDSSYAGINNSNYYTTVVMKTDLSVAHADFAVAPVDRSDAPGQFGFASHYVLEDTLLKMGDLIDTETASVSNTNATGDDKWGINDEDGVEVRATNSTSGSWKKLQDFELSNIEGNYTFRVKVHKKGFLSAWTNFKGNGVNFPNFEGGTKLADNIAYDNGTGYIEFKAEIAPKIATDGGTINGSKVSKVQDIFFRFRYTSYNTTLPPSNVEKESAAANTLPWAVEGEVEDYRAHYQYTQLPGELKGTLIIVNKNFNAKAGDKKPLDPTHADFALYTQIVNLPFDVKMVYYDETNTSIAIDLENPELSVKVDLVDMDSGNCETSTVVQSDIFKGNITKTIKDLNVTVYKAIKNAGFKLTYQYDTSPTPKITCSPDTFSVRPEKFVTDNSFSANLTGGDTTNGKLTAIRHGDAHNASGYNQKGTNIAVKNATLIKPPACLLNDNASGDLTIKVGDFTDGVSNINVTYNNIGKIKISIKDSVWTTIDHHQNDCIINSSENHPNARGIVGCDIEMTKEMTFVPDKFEADAVMHNVYNGDFTYLSNDAVMSAYVDTTVKAILSDGSVAKNYHENCFAKDVTYIAELTNDHPFGWSNRGNKTPKQRLIFFQKDIKLTDNNTHENGTGIFKIEQNRFQSGEAKSVSFGFNFRRLVELAENPFRLVPSADFNITKVEDDDTKRFSASIGGDNVTLFYGRAFVDNYEGKSPIHANARYELFCRGCVRGDYNITFSSMNVRDSRWFLNPKHDDRYGYIMRYIANGKTSVTNITPSSDGIGNMQLENHANIEPYQDTIRATTQKWLLNNPDNENATNTSFTVKFIGVPDKWAGKGTANKAKPNATTGKVINPTPHNKTARRIDW
jgi:hypothetical protein